MNQNQGGPDLSPEQRMQVLQVFWQSQAAQSQQPFLAGNSGASPQPDNLGFQALASHPGLVNSQTQPAMLQAMMQMQALQQQQNQLGMAGLLKNLHFPIVSPPNAGAFSPFGFSTQQTQTIPQEITFSHADEDIFARALHDQAEDKNLGETLNSLNEVNGHTTLQWLDFYLWNSVKILQKAKRLESTASGTKIPTPLLNPSSGSSRHTHPSKKIPLQAQERTRHREAHNLSHSPKKTRSYLPSGRNPTSHSPSPPTKIMKTPQGGNKYTEEDIAYFKQYVAHSLRRDPDILDTLHILSAELAERAPHHTAISWRSWIRDHEDIIERIKHQVLNGGMDVGSDSESRRSQPDEDHDAESSSVDEREVSLSSSEDESEVHAQNMQTLKAMGTRVWYLPSERRALGKYIAGVTLAEWDEEQDWTSFQRMHTRHSVSAWKGWYKSHEKEIRRMARRFEIRNAKRKQQATRSIVVTHKQYSPMQGPTPSSSRSQGFSGSNSSVLQKRWRMEDDDESSAPPLAKRSRLFPDVG